MFAVDPAEKFRIQISHITVPITFRSFAGASKEVLAQIQHDCLGTILTEPKFWETDLKEWLQFVREDELLFCPELVRYASVVTMGLKFTDDLTMTALNSAWRNKPETT